MLKPRNPNDTYQISDSIRVNLILAHEPLPAIFVTVSSLVEDMDDGMEKVLDSGTVQAHYSVDRLINGEWKTLAEADFTEKTYDELLPLLDKFFRNAAERAYGTLCKRWTVQYVHIPITGSRKLFAAIHGS